MQRLSQYLTFINEKKAALFIGAGISSIAGCLSLKDLCDQLKELKEVEQFLKGQSSVSPREVIAFCKSRLTTEKEKQIFAGVMRGGLSPNPEKFWKSFLPFIRKIKQLKPFPPIITTNVDCCLTITKEFEMNKIFHLKEHMKVTNFNEGGIFHLHGYIEDSNNQVWDIDDYSKRYIDTDFRNFVLEIFQRYSVLFLGYAFGDTEFLSLIRKAKKECQQPKPHFALLPSDDCPSGVNEAVYMELYNIQTIQYGLKDDFINLFTEWIDSNFSSVAIGRDDQVSFMQRLGEGA
jgi:hypothetical protein